MSRSDEVIELTDAELEAVSAGQAKNVSGNTTPRPDGTTDGQLTKVLGGNSGKFR